MSDVLDRAYFEWLCEKILPTARSHSPIRTHWKLFNLLYRIEFTYSVNYDENRAFDGIQFRNHFLDEYADRSDTFWLNQPCSVLELLVGMAHRLEFMGGGDYKEWFWEMLENAGIIFSTTNDHYWDGQVEEAVRKRIDDIIHRRYQFTGEGGFFPVPDTDKDQRKVELWYQMAEYVVNDM